MARVKAVAARLCSSKAADTVSAGRPAAACFRPTAAAGTARHRRCRRLLARPCSGGPFCGQHRPAPYQPGARARWRLSHSPGAGEEVRRRGARRGAAPARCIAVACLQWLPCLPPSFALTPHLRPTCPCPPDLPCCRQRALMPPPRPLLWCSPLPPTPPCRPSSRLQARHQVWVSGWAGTRAGVALQSPMHAAAQEKAPGGRTPPQSLLPLTAVKPLPVEPWQHPSIARRFCARPLCQAPRAARSTTASEARSRTCGTKSRRSRPAPRQAGVQLPLCSAAGGAAAAAGAALPAGPWPNSCWVPHCRCGTLLSSACPSAKP